jgi:hypothetical protein
VVELVTFGGAQTNAGRPNVGHGIGPGEGLLDPTAILPAVELEVLGRTEILGRPAHRLRAVPVDGDDDFGPCDALHALGSGADEYELVVDAERGFLLCSEARLRGEPFLLLEITELSLDNDLPPDTFMLDAPPGEGFEAVEPSRRTTLDRLARLVPFTVFGPGAASGAT